MAKVLTSEYGIGMVVDIEGNCRFYDLLRFKKMAKVSPNSQRDTIVSKSCNKWRLMPGPAVEIV